MSVSLVVIAEKKSSKKITPTSNPQQISPPVSKQKVKKPVRTTTATSKQKPQPAMVAENNTTPQATPVSVVKSDSTSPSNTDHDSKQQLQSVLRNAFNAHFYYPRLAVRRGWSGVVRLSLKIEANGHLSNVSILQGSGFDLLDQAAIDSLDKVEVLPEAIALLDGRSLDVVLPVTYRLL